MSSVFSNRILPRERVTETLAAAVASRSLTVLTAPMGYGKTTAAREFAALSGRRASFATVPPPLQGEHSPRYLWKVLWGQFAAQGFGIASELQRMGFPEDPFQMDHIVDICLAHPGSDLLVIDDYHNARNPDFDAFIESLVRAWMPNVSLLLLSRERPNLPLEELALKGLAAHLDQSLLAFSEEETRELFHLHQVSDDEAASRTFHLCEGWAAAIWISLQNWLAHGVTAPSRDMEFLLEKTLFPSYGPEEQRLLLSLSILEEFTPPQAAAISNEADVPRRLRDLSGKNALIAYVPAADSYALHSIFRTFLARRLEEESTIDKPALYRRAGEWFALYGDPVRAIHFFAQAGRDEDLLRILELFEAPGDGLIVVLDPEGIPPIMEAIPWRVRLQCPVGWLGFVYHYLIMINPQRASPLLEESVRRFTKADFTPDLRCRLSGEVALIHGMVAFNDLRTMFRHYHEGAQLLGDTPSRLQLPHHVWTFGSPHVGYQYLREPGEYEDLAQLVLTGFQHYQKASGGCGAGLPELFAAERHLERGSLDQVEPLVLKALFKAMSKNQTTSLVVANFALARLRLAQGMRSEALELMRGLEPVVAAVRNTLLDTLLRIAQGYIGAVAADAASTDLWLRNGRETVAETLRQGQTFTFMVYSGSLMAAGLWVELEALGESLEEDLTRFRNLFGYIHALLMRSVGAYHLRGLDAALPLFTRALNLARPDGIMLTVAEYGPCILPLVEALTECRKENGEPDAYLRDLLRFTRVFTAVAGQGGKKGPLLTRRQEEFLRLAASGASNADIAEHFQVRPDTVKKILSATYTRLGAHNRAEAVRIFTEARGKYIFQK